MLVSEEKSKRRVLFTLGMVKRKKKEKRWLDVVLKVRLLRVWALAPPSTIATSRTQPERIWQAPFSPSASSHSVHKNICLLSTLNKTPEQVGVKPDSLLWSFLLSLYQKSDFPPNSLDSCSGLFLSRHNKRGRGEAAVGGSLR